MTIKLFYFIYKTNEMEKKRARSDTDLKMERPLFFFYNLKMADACSSCGVPNGTVGKRSARSLSLPSKS